jgi:rod shape-determining protein MreC
MKARNVLGSIITTVLVLLVLVTNQTFSLNLGGKLSGFFSPVGIVISSTGQNIRGFFANITHIGTLQKENNDLNQQLDESLAMIARLSESKKENDALKAALGFKQTGALDLIPADVAYFDPSLRDGITVRVDNTDGIGIGKVVLSQGYLIGRVAKIEGNNIRILLITDSKSSLPVTLQSKAVTGIAKGKIGNGLILEQVPQSDNVTVGDTVITSGLGGDLPKGLIIGKVDDIQKVSGSIFQSIVLRPALDFAHIERVMIAR